MKPGAGVAIVLASTVLLFASYKVPSYQGDVRQVHFIYLGLLAGVLLLFAWTAVLANSGWAAVRRFVPPVVILLVAAELTTNYLFPVYYLFGQLPTVDRNPYTGSPYIAFLQQKRRDYYRIFARDGVLFPNWASAFGLYDVRYVYGVTYDRYLRFSRAFLAPGSEGLSGELLDRFTGYSRPYPMGSPLSDGTCSYHRSGTWPHPPPLSSTNRN